MFRKSILHIVSDEKFIDSAYREFMESPRINNIFIIPEKKSTLKHIKYARVYFINSKYFPYLLPIISIFFKAIIFHNLYKNSHKKAIKLIPNWVKVCWISWGFDLYPLLNGQEYYLKIKTKELLTSSDQLYKLIKSENNSIISKEVFNRINYISPVLPSEFDLLKTKYNLKDSQYISWNYYNLEEDIVKDFKDKSISGDNILIGHCASINLNHVDAFDSILESNLHFDKVVCPLSYGDMKYAEFVSKIGFEKFGNRFCPISTFLPYKDYVKILASCKYSVFNSIRQIGMGNIVLMIYLGSRVILDRNCDVYKFFVEKGIPIIPIDSINEEFIEYDFDYVHSKLREIWGKSNKLKRTQDFISVMIN